MTDTFIPTLPPAVVMRAHAGSGGIVTVSVAVLNPRGDLVQAGHFTVDRYTYGTTLGPVLVDAKHNIDKFHFQEDL